jgi:hypothetical protein
MLTMKKLIVAFCLLIPTLGTNAQGLQLGLKANPIISFLQPETEGVTNNGAKLGFSYGLMIDGYFSDNYALATEFSIASMSGKMSQVNGTGKDNLVYRLQYLEIPVALRLTASPMGKVSFYGLFGLGTGIRLKARGDKDQVDQQGVVSEVYKDKDLSESIGVFRAALNMGAGVKYSLGGNTAAQFGVTYSNGLNDINTTDQIKVKLSYVSINLGIFF